MTIASTTRHLRREKRRGDRVKFSIKNIPDFQVLSFLSSSTVLQHNIDTNNDQCLYSICVYFVKSSEYHTIIGPEVC